MSQPWSKILYMEEVQDLNTKKTILYWNLPPRGVKYVCYIYELHFETLQEK